MNTVDWVAAGAVTPIKDQGQCGSCYTFSATGAIEAAVFIKTGTLYSLSEQQLVDCTSSGSVYGNAGCNGGWMDSCFAYVLANGGLCSEAAYPYIALQHPSCSTTCSIVSASRLTGFVDVPSSNLAAFKAALAQRPLAVAVVAGSSYWQFYSSGIVPGSAPCTVVDHAVLAVGFSVSGNYVRLKNQWGTSWGEAGYIRLSLTSTSAAGTLCVLQYPSYPTV